jgi:L-lactate utilization protein LutB
MQNHPLWKAIEEASGGTRETLKESLYNIPEIKSLRDKVRDLMKKAFEGLNESKIEEHLNDIEKMDKLLKIGKVSDKFGV